MYFWERNFLIQCYGTFPGSFRCKGLEVFLYSALEIFAILQIAASRLIVVWNRRGMSSQLRLQNVRRESGGDEQPSDQKILPVHGFKWAGVWRGRGLSGSAYTV
jgi:hypothetical protein